jgi:hypothetical protein
LRKWKYMCEMKDKVNIKKGIRKAKLN